MAKKTSIRQEMFCRNYVIDLNGTRSALAAGYSQKNASQASSELLRNPKVQRRLDELNAARASKLELKAEHVVEELRRLAFSNMHDYMRVDDEGRPILDLSTLSRDQAAAILEIREDATGGTGDGERRQVLRTTFKLADKTKNLELLGRHLGMFTDKMEVSGFEGIAEALQRIRDRKRGS